MPFLASLPPDGPAREAYISAAISAGQLDAPPLVPVTMGSVTLSVSADYLTIDGSRIPMAAATAQRAVDALGGILPTAKMVDAIEAEARRAGRIVYFDAWHRWQDDSQLYTSTIEWREENIAKQTDGMPAGTLIAGCLKDVVIARVMPPGKVVIYGGIEIDKNKVERRVQPLYAGHGAFFSQGYAGGVRLVRRDGEVAGEPVDVETILTDPALCSQLTAGGPLLRTRYPT